MFSYEYIAKFLRTAFFCRTLPVAAFLKGTSVCYLEVCYANVSLKSEVRVTLYCDDRAELFQVLVIIMLMKHEYLLLWFKVDIFTHVLLKPNTLSIFLENLFPSSKKGEEERKLWKAGTVRKNVFPFFVSLISSRNRLTLSWRRLLSYRNQSIDLGSKSVNWFLYDNGLRHERVK